MGWIRDLFSLSDERADEVQQQDEEQFPMHTYGIGYPIVLHQQELEDLYRLLEIEERTPDSWDDMPFMSREDMQEIVDGVVEDATGGDLSEGMPTPEERRAEIREILDLWQNQMNGENGVVWTTIGTDHHFQFYITHCEARSDAEHDDFEEPEELDTTREIFERIQSSQGDPRKRAIVHKGNLPLEEPEEDQRSILEE